MKQKNIISFCLFAAFAVTTFSCNQATESEETPVVTEAVKTVSEPVKPAQQVQANIDKNKLAGNWVRTDAPYHLKITDVSDNGTMKAEYLNPKPIHVAKATWTTDVNGAINMYVELRDENYPGSNYTLLYIPDKDLLAGKYFQAVEAVTYDVGFRRAK